MIGNTAHLGEYLLREVLAELIQIHESAPGQQQTAAAALVTVGQQEGADLGVVRHVVRQVQGGRSHVHAQLPGGVHGDAQAVVVEDFLKTHPSLYAADAHGLFPLCVFQRKKIEARFRGTALAEGIPGVIDFFLQQVPVCR